MSFIIREGEKKDAQSILNLIIELAIFEKEPNAVEINLETLILDGFSDNPKFKTFVAQEIDGTIIGMTLFYERYSTWKGKSIHLEDLMVTQTKRGIGAGKKLYGSVMNYAQKNGFKRVAWEVLDWNTNAIDFYKNTGATVYNQWRVCQMDEQHLTQFCNENI
ncbi:GNAT family N-acetyltransferase [Tenacibaculum finnmarkense]|uniref:GNAT family acetyltransferase n=1 Tax=Tenacibaculum finnmarkense genomovar ulcerans TaxID=2781388 RepID=A0A2I2M6T5_9FLAO|nr:GNAT family N-acetyltransferase [Tenacibaculum finnmarkense]ALU75892.1 GNAT family acetyltransferase [Tenacibaculum dicentrarchi]MBE7633356.1 GNAT family N-acetyltransferase [Tenacibaculum finnmarkense genomovar ulcerans]MBE7644988.1 GNAT family N-acetyltransferase [Tenacibaculum finnmarkense genomovar ulcerans]MBE7647145.1 GNAT family N-acetyltransferase [Tenacibaculum finnmarkense genomovar ulcerans]MBE7686921.1 GNAT family N-acetyltransferase [Tenacibaculum finnmarkense genomovar ulceran